MPGHDGATNDHHQYDRPRHPPLFHLRILHNPRRYNHQSNHLHFLPRPRRFLRRYFHPFLHLHYQLYLLTVQENHLIITHPFEILSFLTNNKFIRFSEQPDVYSVTDVLLWLE